MIHSGMRIGSTCSSSEFMMSFVARLLGDPCNEFLCYIQREYVIDNFNLYGLREIPLFHEAMDLILGNR